jgi:hypothetical protein
VNTIPIEPLSHFIPSHFFECGPYEVWASKDYTSRNICRIAKGLSLETAKAFNWPFKQIRLNGEIVK